MDYEARQLAKQQRRAIQAHLLIDDLKVFGLLYEDPPETFGVELPFHDRKVNVIFRDRGYTNLRERGNLIELLKKMNDKHLLICLNERWLGLLQVGQLYLYNCHPSQPDENLPYQGNDPAVIVRAESLEQLSRIIILYGACKEGDDILVSFFALEHMTD